MKTNAIKGLAVLAIAGFFTTSCDLLKGVEYTVTPDPLEMHGDKVKVKVDVFVPEKGIKKNVYAEVTPRLGNHELKQVIIQGEKASANGVVIPYKTGGTFTYEDEIAYSPDMEVSELTVEGVLFKKGKEKGEIETMKIADATVVTPFLVNNDFRVIAEKDNFVRVTQETEKASIFYLKGKYDVRATELKSNDINSLVAFLTEEQNNPKLEIKSIDIQAWASIEGEEGRNNELSTNRANSAKEALMKLAAGKKVANAKASEAGSYSTKGNGEDYEGFKKGLQESTMDAGDKDRIFRVLDMYTSSEEREKAIRDLSTFLYLDKNVFPAQRRSEITVNYDKIGYSDEEMLAIVQSDVNVLNLEEMLYVATLIEDLGEKMRVYKAAEAKYPSDHRPANNVGVMYYLQNNLGQAEAQFNKANGINSTPVVKNNLAAIKGINGDREGSKALLGQAGGAGSEVSYNKGILNILDGEYDAAISNFGGEASFNKALAQLLNKDQNSANSTLGNSEDAESAQGYYLKAIIGARNNSIEQVVSNLAKAFARDASWKQKAAKDREFVKFFENSQFQNIVQ